MKRKPIVYNSKSLRRSVLLTPIIAILLFVILYSIAAFDYPGGSWILPYQEGFSFWNNYLCDLLDEYAINGELNTARYIARGSLAVLCSGLMVLWYVLPNMFSTKSVNQAIMRNTGILALVTILFLASGTHDITVRIAGFFGIIAFLTCFVELFKAGYFIRFLFGIICLLVFLANYYIYETGILIAMLPVIQKITFILFFGWFISLNLVLYKKLK